MVTDANKLRSFINQLVPAAEAYGKKSVISNIEKQISRIESSTSVLFCGEFKRGKSSLVNAIIGGDLCPTDEGIATSVVSIIRYGSVKKAFRYYGNLLENVDSLKKEEIEWEDIAKYSMGDVLNIDNTILIELYYPAEFLKDGVTIIDTPGIGGLDPRHAILTQMALPKADVIVFVTDAGEPMTESELNFYKSKVIPCGKNHLVLVNKSDLLPLEDLKLHVDNTKFQLAQYGSPDVVVVSSKSWKLYNQKPNDKFLSKSNRNEVLTYITYLVESCRKDQLINLRNMLVSEVAEISISVKTEIEQLKANSSTHKERMAVLQGELEELKQFISDTRNPQSALNLRINTIFDDTRNEVMNLISHEGGVITSIDFESLLKSEKGLDNDGKWLVAQINQKLHDLSNTVNNNIDTAFEEISNVLESEITNFFTTGNNLISGDLKELKIFTSQLAFSLAGKVALSSGILMGAIGLGIITGPIGIVMGLATTVGLIWRGISNETRERQMFEIRQQVLPKINLAITDMRNQANTRFTKFHQNLLQTLQTLAAETEEKIKAIQSSMKESYGNEQECKNKVSVLEQRDKFLETVKTQLNILYSSPFNNGK